jgi:molecular chaperone HtpG
MEKQTLSFQAEVKHILHLVTHSLYSNKEIFLRELISNASDACDKLRFEALDNAALYEDTPHLEIRVFYDASANTLTISDNGIGMSRDEAVQHLGTIARSGTREFMAQLEGDQKKDANLIGQFGVGFYSGFIVADRITVESRRAGLPAEQGMRWSSGGTGEFEVEAITRPERGTDVILHLREGEEDYLKAWKLRGVIGKYSDHVSLPILMRKEEWVADKAEYVLKDEWETVNKASALWTRPKGEISEEQYQEFYKTISHDTDAPLAWTHNRVEGRSEYTQLLYLPAKAPFDLWNRDRRQGVKLYVRRVFVMDDAQDLMPTYLRFVRGVIDSSDLPLNVSRELLQESRDVKAIREGSTKRVLSMLEDLAEQQQEKYAAWWKEFGAVLKEGAGEDQANQERLAKLFRFASTHADEGVSFTDYVSRMKEGQDRIYYLLAESHARAIASPHLEQLRKKDIEVLLLTDRIDPWLVDALREYEGKEFADVVREDLSLPEAEGIITQEVGNEQHKPLLKKIKRVLKDRVAAVNVSRRLVDSPACVVAGEGDLNPSLKRMLEATGQSLPETKPILEVNVGHPLLERLSAETDEERFNALSHTLLDHAMLAEGSQVDNPAEYVARMNLLLLELDSAPGGK